MLFQTTLRFLSSEWMRKFQAGHNHSSTEPVPEVAGAASDVRIAWMDQRNSPHWNVYWQEC
jgi:hypothetical protein